MLSTDTVRWPSPRVPVGHGLGRVILGSIIVRELYDAVAVGPVTGSRERFWSIVYDEAEGIFALREVKSVDLRQTKKLVEPG